MSARFPWGALLRPLNNYRTGGLQFYQYAKFSNYKALSGRQDAFIYAW